MIAILALVTLLAQAAPATPPPGPLHQNEAPVRKVPAPMPIPPIVGIDRIFAVAAVQGNDAELDMAQLALRRTSAPEVKGFAQKMIGEHMGLVDDMAPALLRVLPERRIERLAVPDQLAFAHLQTIPDVDFDQVYAMQQIGDHLATLTAFRTEADNGTDAQLKTLARKWIPTIEAHLQLAISLTQRIGGESPFKSH